MAKIGLIQVDNKMSGEIKDRHDALIELGTKCLEDGADLVFFPEAFQYVMNRQIIQDKQRLLEVSAAWQDRCAALAKSYHAYVVPWEYYLGEDGGIRNSSYILDRDGNLVGRYCKSNLTSSEMDWGLVHGTELPVFDLDIGKVGIMICFDNYFPEVAAALGNKGAELILYPLFGDTLKPQWDMKLRTRAADHSLYVAPCQLTSKWDTVYTGMVDPEGNVIARLDTVNSYCVVEIEMGKAVWSNTSANPPYGENLREYLHKCRNYKVFGSLADEGRKSLDWDEIFYKE